MDAFRCRACILLTALGVLVVATEAEDTGFRPLFNGRDLSGWDGDPAVWSVQDGAIRGQSSLAHPVFRNTFCIWRGGTLKDFELRVRFRIHSGNSGIQYRSKDLGKWAIAGYQAEVVNEQGKAGFLYEEKGRGWLAKVGESVVATADGSLKITGHLATKEQLIGAGYYRDKDWNDYRIVAKGNRIAHYLNGLQTVAFTDENAARSLEGVLALQIHAGPPMTVEFKDILLKNL